MSRPPWRPHLRTRRGDSTRRAFMVTQPSHQAMSDVRPLRIGRAPDCDYRPRQDWSDQCSAAGDAALVGGCASLNPRDCQRITTALPSDPPPVRPAIKSPRSLT